MYGIQTHRKPLRRPANKLGDAESPGQHVDGVDMHDAGLWNHGMHRRLDRRPQSVLRGCVFLASLDRRMNLRYRDRKNDLLRIGVDEPLTGSLNPQLAPKLE